MKFGITEDLQKALNVQEFKAVVLWIWKNYSHKWRGVHYLWPKIEKVHN